MFEECYAIQLSADIKDSVARQLMVERKEGEIVEVLGMIASNLDHLFAHAITLGPLWDKFQALKEASFGADAKLSYALRDWNEYPETITPERRANMFGYRFDAIVYRTKA